MRLKLSIEEKDEVRRLQRNAVGTPDYVRLTCILMFDNGRSSKSISEDLGISIATVYRYVGDYLSGGIDNLLESHCQGYWGKLDSMQLCTLRNELREHIYTDAKSVSEWIRVTFGVSYTPQGTVDLLNRIGFTYKKTTEVPCEADACKQAEFLRKKVINTGFYRTKEEFRRAIRRFFDNIESFKEELESLLTLKFRLCNSQTISF